MEEQGIWKEQWKVAAFMVDPNQRIRLKALADILQELANNHANYRKCGFEDMKAHGKFWVLNRQAIIIDTWPIWEQPIQVESWISLMKGPFSKRHFAVYDEKGNTMVRASYLWTCIDREKIKPAAIPEGDYPIIPHRDIELPEPTKLRRSGDKVASKNYTVSESDLDIIGHTNNASYLQWVSNALTGHSISYNRIDANYTGESFLDQEVSIDILQSENGETSVEVVNTSDACIFNIKFTSEVK